MEVLVAICLVVGLFPAYTVGPLLASAALATLGGPLPALQPEPVAWRQPALC
ncbi:hypothetical protein ACU4GD_21295 [Cupriavidus basilensis]